MAAGRTRSEISDSIVIGPAILGRDITVMLPPQVPLATSGLPAASPAFTGRQTDLDRLLKLLAPQPTADGEGSHGDSGEAGGCPSAVVVSAVGGMAGVGKTELAVQAARAALRNGWFPGGVLFADLFGYDDERRRDPDEVLTGMLHCLGVPGEHVPGHGQDRARMFCSILAEFAAQDRRILVVADNISGHAQARPLLPTDGQCAAIVTSRHTLALLNARLLDLNVLDPDAAVAMLDQTLRVALPDDTRVPGDPDGSRELARVCGGLPLALRIATALLAENDTLTPAMLAGELATVQPLRGLTYGPDGVRRAFELSYRTLTDPQRCLFRLLALNPGPQISTPAAAALAGQDEPATRIVLKELARAHLIERGHAADRWQMHDLVRQYATDLIHAQDDAAVDKAACADPDQALTRLLGYYLDTTDAATAHLDPTVTDPDTRGFSTREQALDWLDVELSNLAAAAQAAAERHPDIAIGLPLDLAGYLDWRRLFNDSITLTTLALETARHTGDRHREGAALNNLGNALRKVRRFEEAITTQTDAAAIFREIGDRHSEGQALNNLGLALQEVRRFEEAITTCTDAATIFRELGDRHREGQALNNLGLALAEMRRFDEAITTCTDAATIFRELGDRHREGLALNNLGLALQEVRRFEEAVTAHTDAAAILRETGDRHGEGRTLGNLGLALQKMRRFEEAITPLQQDLAIGRELGNRHGEAQALNNLGVTLQQLWRFEEAITAHTDAAAIHRETGDRHREGAALNNLGNALRHVGRFDEANTAHQQAIAVYRELGDRHREAAALAGRGSALQELGRFEEAITACTDAAAIFREIGDRHSEGQAVGNLGLALQRVGLFEEAITAHQQAATILAELGDRHREGQALNNLGLALQEVEQFGEAITALTRAAEIFEQFGDEDDRGIALGNLEAARQSRKSAE